MTDKFASKSENKHANSKNSLLQCHFVGSHKVWARFKVSLPTSNDTALGLIFHIKWSHQGKAFTGLPSCFVSITLDSVKLTSKTSYLSSWGQATCGKDKASERPLCEVVNFVKPMLWQRSQDVGGYQSHLCQGGLPKARGTSPQERCMMQAAKLEESL